MKTILSSPSKDGLELMAKKYFYSESVTIKENEVHNSKGKINGYEVREAKGRFKMISI